ncbi:cupin domain-containing protein [Alteromonas flava]|uniref:cupin domain-containing protein n=1 Tax=Alteromonas flava TaxID=2048003 RepID=UPI000C28EFDB|nr:cupin domain-containing protein [Alteromonas flava]
MQQLIDALKLKPHPEGGFYSEVYRSAQTIDSPIHSHPRPALTHIYFLLLAGQVSRFHRVVHDEIWNFYAGAPLRLLHIHNHQSQSAEAQTTSESVIIGSANRFAHVIEGGQWQAAESTGDYSLVGCSVAPGFDFADFEFMSNTDAAWVKQHRREWLRFI